MKPLFKTVILLFFSFSLFHVVYAENENKSEYSKKQLKEAKEILHEHRDELEITGYSIDSESQRMRVYAEEWTEEKEKRIKELLQMDSILFIEDYGTVVEDQFIPLNYFVVKFEEMNSEKSSSMHPAIHMEMNAEVLDFNKDTGIPFLDADQKVQFPIRYLSDLLKCNLIWEKETNTVYLTKEDKIKLQRRSTAEIKDESITVEIPYNQTYLVVNGERIELNAKSSQLQDGKIYCPVQAVLDALKIEYKWEEDKSCLEVYFSAYL